MKLVMKNFPLIIFKDNSDRKYPLANFNVITHENVSVTN